MTKKPMVKKPRPADDRGDFRSMYSVLFDSPEYEDLSLEASHLLVTVKHSLGPAGIGVLEVATLQRRSKLTDPRIFERARDELIDGRWIQVERQVWWLRNGLRFEPSMSSENENHVKSVQRYLNGLPKLPIANRMAAYYIRFGWAVSEPFPSLGGNGMAMGSGTHPNGMDYPSKKEWVPDGISITEPLTETLTEPLTETDTESESHAREDSPSASNPDFDGYTPTNDQRARAAELRIDLDSTLRTWRAKRKAKGAVPVDLVADFDGWVEDEPGFTRSNAHPAPATPVRPPAYVPPPEPELASPEDARRIARETAAALKPGGAPKPNGHHAPAEPMPEPSIRDPEKAAEFEERKRRALTLARGGKP